MRPSLSIVVPVYNSENSIGLLVEALAELLPEIASDYEMILVNDGSRDNSWDVVQSLARQYTWIQGINMMRNYGQHNALLCGIRAVRYDVTVTMDDDLQHPPTEISRLLAVLDEGYDVAYGAPKNERHGIFRNLASQMTKLALQKSMGAETARHVSAFRAFRTTLREAFVDFRGPFVSIDVLLTWGTTRFKVIFVAHEQRTIGQSNYTLVKLITHAFNMMTGFSTIPLQMATLLGFVMTGFGFLVMVYLLFNRFILANDVPGFTFLASIIAIFAGAQMFALGIMGEYLARMHFRIMDRPAYTIRETTATPIAEQEH